MFLEKQKNCVQSKLCSSCHRSNQPRCFRQGLLVLHGKTECTLPSACSVLRTKAAVVGHPRHGDQLSEHLRFMTQLVLNSELVSGHSEAFHCCQIFHTLPHCYITHGVMTHSLRSCNINKKIHFSQF